ncbi:hypothetical protein [Natrialba asiatica]|uniref:Small CPxCG-related zinc finger protein n=1 Tax=Natrialba asiatica (strain ATCC 700177 / DSM 12278 / JCM 9576 / FERM P-10747 / NBRC 102637 / 172P1) TaxID=29540 RepID=M0AXF9_NATA1|nr:hypothetical protein [Natrialba asiatica]ELZ03381.1 hypothetical protein C481_05280 [Natrialba asiatica DSM 12278]
MTDEFASDRSTAETDSDPGNSVDRDDSAGSDGPRRCPRCDTPILRTTVIGPTEAIAGPCGCRVAPPVPDRSD